MDMIEAYRTCIKKYASFQGRARRSEYWLFSLCNSLIGLLFTGAGYFAEAQKSENFITGISVASIVYSLFVLLPGLAVTVRRLHDTGHSGWYYFIAFIPIVGPIVLLVSLCKDSVPGSNAYGSNPKEIGEYVSSNITPNWVNEDTPPVSQYDSYARIGGGIGETVKVETGSYETVTIKPTLKVRCITGPIAGKTAVGEAIYVGRDPKLCQLVFPDDTPGVSKVHCMLHTNGRSIEICDLGSSYGTFLSDKTRLKPNETFYFIDGNTTAPANQPSTNTIYIGSENITISVKLSSPLPV